MEKRFAVAIIGASLAGSSLALRLARQGIDVALFDQARFPRRKACGEGLSTVAIEKFVELGLGPQLFALPHGDFRGYCFHDVGRRGFSIFFDQENPRGTKGIGVSRYLLDQMVLQETAGKDTVSFFPAHRIVAVDRDQCGFVIRSKQADFRSRFLVLACGAGSVLPSKLQIPQQHLHSGRFGVAMEIEPIGGTTLNSELVNIFTEAGMQVMLTPLVAGRYNLSAIISKTSCSPVRWRERIERLLAHQGVRFAIVSEPLGVGGIGRYRCAAYHRDIFVVGDCLEQFDPVGGMGMTHALLSSEITAATLIQLLGSEEPAMSLLLRRHQYYLTHEKRPLRGFTRLSYFHMLQAGIIGARHSRYLRPIAQKVVSAVSGLGHPERQSSLLGMFLVNLSGINLWAI